MPDARDFLVPDLGEGLEDATIVGWAVAVGDEVELNQTLCTVETAKAEVDVPSPFRGTVLALGGDEGETLRVGTLLARIGSGVPADAASESAAEPEQAAGRAGRGDATETEAGAAPAASPSGRQPTLVGYGHDDAIDRSRRARGGPARPGGALSGSAAPAGRSEVRRPGGAAAELGAPVSQSGTAGGDRAVSASGGPAGRGGRPLAKPPVRLLARKLGVDLAGIAPGSGPGGIVTRSDVTAAAASPAGAPPVASPSANGAAAPAAGSTIAVRGIRARIAERMATSRARIPDATASVTVDCSRLLEVRAALNDHAERRGLERVVTPFSLLSALTVRVLGANPMLNSTFVDDGPEIRLHGAVHLGIGTATDRGLVVTVVRDAQNLAVHALSKEMAGLAQGARAGSLGPEQLSGSTFTISNFGALGLDEGIPIVNYPEAAILGVGSIKPRPHVVDGAVVARPTASVTLAFDHRVCDGAEAGRFLSGLRDLVEQPELALLGP